MGQYERLVLMAEDELTEYSTDARKREKLRRKIGLSVNLNEQKAVKEQLEGELPQSGLVRLVEDQRQTVALPFWGIAGLGLLFGISFMQPVDFVATVVGGIAAVQLQKWGWRLQAKRLMLKTLEEIEDRRAHPEKYPD